MLSDLIDGEGEFTRFTRDVEKNRARGLSDDTITDNLLIRGNNLIALHCIKSQFAGKVKLIYIDPPITQVMMAQQRQISKLTW